MSVDPKKFGLSNSLVNAVNEALKGSQHKIDVAEPKGKITGADFKKLRGEGAKPDFLDLDKDGNKKEPMKHAAKQTKEEVEQVDELSKATMGSYVKKASDSAATHTGAAAAYGSSGKNPDAKKMAQHQAVATKRKMGINTAVSKLTKEEIVVEADDAVAKQIAAKKEAMKKQIQQKIAQKQMQVMQSKAQKRLSSINASNDKCTCGDTNESKMKCEMHGGKHDDKKGKGGREAIVMNPPLKEAEELPKNVVKKGHEIAKSLIKHRAKVKEPYAVGMATAKKSAGIKD